MIKVRIATPLPSECSIDTTPAGISTKKLGNIPGVSYTHAVVHGANIAKTRNTLINLGQNDKKHQSNLDFDVILFVDSDIEFSKENFLKIINSPHGITSGLYYGHQGKYINAGNWKDGITGWGKKFSSDFCFMKCGGYMPVDFCGAGFLAIKSDVLPKIQFPWFRHINVEYGDQANQTDEDWGFCINAKEYGIQTYLDYNIVLKHHNLQKGINMQQEKQPAKTLIQSKLFNIIKDVIEVSDMFEEVESEYKKLAVAMKELKQQKQN